jgi:hypothetical protein
MLDRNFIVRGGLAAALAVGLAAAPVSADEIEVEEVIVAEEVVAEVVEPCPECPNNNGAVSFAVGSDITNAYFFRGILQEKNGFIWQPWGEVTFNVWSGEGIINDVSLTLGTWNSIQTEQTGSPGDGNGPGNWYESDIYAGVAVGLPYNLSAGLTYVAYTSPNNAFGTVQEIDLDASYDDSGMYSGQLADLGFSTNPYAIVAFEFDKTAFGGDEGIYMELGAEPAVTVMQESDYPITVGMPLTLGLSLDNYYKPSNAPNGSNPGDDTFGYATVGLSAAVPLSFMPANLGSFSAGLSGKWIALGSNLQRVNVGITDPTDGKFSDWIGTFSVNWEY